MTAKSKSDLLREYTPFAMTVASKFSGGQPAWRRSEIRQSALIGLWKAIENYDPGRGASLKTYAGIRIKGEIVDEMRQQTFFGRRAKERGISVHSEAEEFCFDHADLSDSDNKVFLDEVLQILPGLPIKYQEAIAAMVGGQGCGMELADDFGVSQSRISQFKNEAIGMIRKKLRIAA